MRIRPAARGFTLITAVFLIVVLTALAAFMITITTTQRQTSTLSVLGSRAFFASQSGMERAIHSVLSGGTCFGSPLIFNLTGGATNGFQVVLSCQERPVSEGPDNFRVYALQSVASRGTVGTPDFVSRTINATVTDAP